MYTSILEDIGLTEDQIKIYQYLLQKGPRQAGQISIGTGLSRTFVYKVIEQLTEMKLVDIEDNKKVNKYTVTNPTALMDMLERKIQEKKNVKESLAAVMGSMSSDYNSFSNKPSVRFFEGRQGLQELYDDIILEKQDIYLLRSPLDTKFSLGEMVDNQKDRQVAQKIHTKAITPDTFGKDLDRERMIEHDKQFLITRRMSSRDHFNVPAQVILYGNKVGITSYKKGIYTTIIDNKDIQETFRKVFDFVWENTDPLDIDSV